MSGFRHAVLILALSPVAFAQAPAGLHQWVNISSDPFLANLWPGGGSTDSGYTEYVCRGRVQGATLPGRYAPNVAKACFVGFQGMEIILNDFEVLIDFSGLWVPASTTPNGFRPIPESSLEAGVGSDGRPVYACRGFYRGLVHLGQYSSTGCQIGLNGVGAVLPEYEVLVNPWIFGNADPSLLLNADSSPRTAYVCRAEAGGSIYPGLYQWIGIRGCAITPAGNLPSRLVGNRFEVLSSTITGVWVPATGLIPGAFRAGRAIRAAVDMTFLCRAPSAGGVLPGKTSGGPCTLPTDAVAANYEVFVATPNLNLATYRLYTKATGRFWVRRDGDQLINTLTQPNTDASRFQFARNSDGSYRLIATDNNRILLHDENRDRLLKANGEATDPYANFFIEQLGDQGSYRLRTVGGTQAYIGENATDRLISSRSQTDNDSLRVLLQPAYPTRLQFSAVTPGFGNVPFGSTPTKTLTVTNSTGQPVSFTVSATGNGFSQANNCPPLLGNSNSCVVTISFSPAADGAVAGTVTLAEAVGTTTAFPFQATGVAPASLSAPTLNFPTLQSGQRSAGQLVTVTNLTAFPLMITSATVDGQYAAFSSCGTTLAARGSCGVVLTFQPVGTGTGSGSSGVNPVASPGTYTVRLRNATGSYSTQVVVTLTGSFFLANPLVPPQPAPAEGRLVNSASFARLQPLAPNSIATIFGEGLSAQTVINSANPPPATLGGVTLTVRDDVGTTAQAQLFFVSPTQINFLMPALNPAATLVLITDANGRTYNALIAPVAPGIFQASPSTVPAAFYDRYDARGLPIELNRLVLIPGPPIEAAMIPRNPGESLYLLLYGTGIRARNAATMTATIGGVNVPIAFAGPQGQFPGQDQINLGPLPASVPSGLREIRLSFNGIPANVVTIRLQ